MACARSNVLAIGSLLLLLAGILHGEEAKSPLKDLYCDSLPTGAVMRLGTIHLRHLRHRGIAVTFSKDGKHLISCGSYEVRVWDAATGRLVRRTRLAWKADEGDWHAQVRLTPDGTTAAVWDWGGLTRCLYDTATGRERGRLPNNAWVLAFSPDSKKMVVDQQDREGKGPVQLWDIVEFKKEVNLEVPPRTVLRMAAFTPDGKQLAALVGEGSTELLVWDAATGKVKQRKKFPTSMASLAYAPDGATLAVGRHGWAEAVLYDVATWKEKAVLPARANIKGGEYVFPLGFSPDGRFLAASYTDMAIPGGEVGFVIWDLSKPQRPRQLLSQSQIGTFSFAPDGKTLAYRDSNSDVIDLWDATSGRRFRQPPGHETLVGKLAVSPDGKFLASGDYKPTLYLWDTGTGKLLRSLAQGDRVVSPWLFSADGRQMISVSGERKIQVWEVATGKELSQFAVDPPPGNGLWSSTVETVALSGDGKRLAAVVSTYVAVASDPDILPQLYIWDTATGKQLNRRPLTTRVWNHGSAVQKMSYRWPALLTPDGENITEWNGDWLTIEDVSTRSLLAELPRDVGDPRAFSTDGRLLAAVSLQPKKERPDLYDVKGLSLIETATGQEVVRLEIGNFNYAAFTPDSRAVVVVDRHKLSVWDTAMGERLHQMDWPESIRDERGDAKLSSLAVLQGGRAATGTTEGDILVWDLAPSTWPIRRMARELSRDQFDALWSDLARDARTAHRAVSLLEAAPAWSVPLLDAHLHRVTVDNKRIEKLLADLDDDVFETRERATRELTRLRYRVEPMLRRALEYKPSLEVRRRLETILAEPKRPPAADLRMLRAIAVLERIGTSEARRILEKLADREAQAALQRLKYR
ncbi:MAG TPA: WD40 repeat domain-containing protein [Gemmataceae bacterium]|jgi:WD40 repeat protein